jgi:tRNA (guanine-N7-)-methyltransferase
MPRSKKARFAEMEHFANVFQPPLNSPENTICTFSGKWREQVFHNENPIILELGCGRGEYTLGLATAFLQNNYIGIDIKGARMYVGAKKALDSGLKNAAFIRTYIEHIEIFFQSNEVDELWITFPDPQPKKRWTKKRLTSASFQNRYLKILKPTAILHLKTDSEFLYHYTLALLQKNRISVMAHSEDVYESRILEDIYNIRTHYENKFMEQNKKITYIKWHCPEKELTELSDEEYEEIEKQYLRPVTSE